jgi:hypothetical protein
MFGAQPIALHAIEIPRCCAIVYSMTIKMITTDASTCSLHAISSRAAGPCGRSSQI